MYTQMCKRERKKGKDRESWKELSRGINLNCFQHLFLGWYDYDCEVQSYFQHLHNYT